MSAREAPARVLIIRLTALGDVLLATPLLRALRAALPEAEIDWLVAAQFAPLLAGNPNLTTALPWAGERDLRAKLRARRYDLVLDLQNRPMTALLRHRLGAGRVLALRKRTLFGAAASVLGLERISRAPHAVDRYLALTAKLGLPQAASRQPEVVVTARGRREAGALLARRRAAPLWGLAPSTRWATKRWPLERYAEVGARAAKLGAEVLLLGGAGEGAALDAVGATLGPALQGDTRHLTVAGLAAAIEACSVVVAGDCGPAHLAAALGRPTVVLFGPTSPERWAPPGPTVRVVHLALACSPCSNHGSARCPLGTHACMVDLSVDEVFAAALALAPAVRDR